MLGLLEHSRNGEALSVIQALLLIAIVPYPLGAMARRRLSDGR